MGRKRHKPEEIVRKLREAEALSAKGESVERICRALGVSVQTYGRWRREYGSMGSEGVRRLKDLERENARLKKPVAEQALDLEPAKEPARGNF